MVPHRPNVNLWNLWTGDKPVALEFSGILAPLSTIRHCLILERSFVPSFNGHSFIFGSSILVYWYSWTQTRVHLLIYAIAFLIIFFFRMCLLVWDRGHDTTKKREDRIFNFNLSFSVDHSNDSNDNSHSVLFELYFSTRGQLTGLRTNCALIAFRVLLQVSVFNESNKICFADGSHSNLER